MIAILALGVIAWVVLYSDFFKISEVEIAGVDDSELASIHSSVEPLVKDKFSYSMDLSDIQSLVTDKMPGLKVENVKYIFPNKISLTVNERPKQYLIIAQNGLFSVDDEGMVLGSEANTEAAENEVKYDKSLTIGEKIEDPVLKSALEYSTIDENVEVVEDEIIVNLNEGGKVILPQNGAVENVNELSSLLQKIIQKYTIERRNIDLIDLRFDKPVIKYRQ